MLRYLLVIIGLLLITACGQTGPLYLPSGKQPSQQINQNNSPASSGLKSNGGSPRGRSAALSLGDPTRFHTAWAKSNLINTGGL